MSVQYIQYTMMTSSTGNIFRVTGPLWGETTGQWWPVDSPHKVQRPVTRSFDVFFDLYLYKRLSKQLRRRWFETPYVMAGQELRHHCACKMSVTLLTTNPGMISSFLWLSKSFQNGRRDLVAPLSIILLITGWNNVSLLLNSSKPWQDDRHFADDISKFTFLRTKVVVFWFKSHWNMFSISNWVALVQIMGWHRTGEVL